MNKRRVTAMPATPCRAEPDAARAELSRRVMLKLSLAASALLAAGGMVKFLNYDSAAGAPTVFALDRSDAYAAGSATHYAQAGVWLMRDQGGLFAISTRCPHLGCTVDRQTDGFHCPCHGSRFTPDGQVRIGPATRSLSYLKLTVFSQGHVVVHADQVTESSAWLQV